MKPNAQIPSEEVVSGRWTHTSNAQGGFTNQQIDTAALLVVAATLKRIERHLLSLGGDGLHFVLREQAKKLRRQEKERRARARARRTVKGKS